MALRGREIILGVGGGISAYKSADLIRRLQDHGYLVTVIPTRSSQNFVGNATWAALTGREVSDDLWSNVHSVPHIALAQSSDAIIIAPTTADLLSRIAHGRADDLLTSVVLSSKAPLILVPAMHPEMWLNPATQANVQLLRSRGILVIDPEEGRMTGNDFGIGRYPDSKMIIDTLSLALIQRSDLLGVRVLISAGGTREPIDPVRYIGNSSSGKQGYACAFAAARRGAKVTLVSANSSEADIDGIALIKVKTADEMFHEMTDRFGESEIVMMTAAVADAKPSHLANEKLEKNSYREIRLIPTIDILKELGTRKGERILVGFAAQTGPDGYAKALEKYQGKNMDFIYINDVSDGAIFGSDLTSGAIAGSQGLIEHVQEISKLTLADKLLDLAADKLSLDND